MNIEVDLNEVKELIKSDAFSKFLLNHSTDFATSAFILQTLLDRVEEIEKENE